MTEWKNDPFDRFKHVVVILLVIVIPLTVLIGCTQREGNKDKAGVLVITVVRPEETAGFLCVFSERQRIVSMTQLLSSGSLVEAADELSQQLQQWSDSSLQDYKLSRIQVGQDHLEEVDRIVAILDDLSRCGPLEDSSKIWDCRFHTFFVDSERWYATDMRSIFQTLLDHLGITMTWDAILRFISNADPPEIRLVEDPIDISETTSYAYTGELIRCIVQRLEQESR